MFKVFSLSKITRITHVRRIATTRALNKVVALEFHSEFDEKQKSKILDVINKQSEQELAQFNISKSRIKRIEMRKQKQGEFKAINEILELDGFGVKVLEKFCESILSTKDDTELKKKASDASLKTAQVVSPPLSVELRKSITSCVSFHVDVGHIAWTKLTFDASDAFVQSPALPVFVNEWACHAIGKDDKKLVLSDLIQVLIYLNEKIPRADVYVVESQQASRPTTQPGNQTIQMTINVQKSQILAMLGVLMAAREGDVARQNLFFLKNFVSSRLYKTYIGAERVSTDHVIDHIFRCNEGVDRPSNPSLAGIDVPSDLRKQFKEFPKLEKEFIGQSALNGLAFFKLSVLKCPASAAILNRRSNESNSV